MAHEPEADRPDPAEPSSLSALYADMARRDEPPRPGFSDRLVTGEGPIGAPLMLVGEQPGEQEDRLGRPFVGPAGRLLDASLIEAGLERDAVFVTNAVKRFKFEPQGKRRMHRTPNAGDIAHYRWWLTQEVRLVNPAVIVALGATALHALLGKRQTLASLRGTILPWETRKLIATVHPSYLLRLRDPDSRSREQDAFVSDLRRARLSAAQP